MLPTFQQQAAIQHNGASRINRPKALLRSLPLMLLLAASPGFAETEPVQEKKPLELAPLSQDEASSIPKLEATSEPGQTRATLASPPAPEIAETLCHGTAQSLSNQIVITAQTVCQSGLTPPSLWWTKEQVAQELRTSGKLVNTWSAQLKTADSPGQVRLVVNPQMWSLMDYFERYDFVNNFGLAARGFGYQTEIYNTKGTPLASYACSTTDGSATLGSSCTMDLQSSLNFGTRSR